MRGHAQDTGARRRELPLELVGEEQVRGLALPVCAPLRVAPFRLRIIEADPSQAMDAAAHGDDPRAGGWKQEVEQEAGQCEVPEVVGAELHFKAVLRPTIR